MASAPRVADLHKGAITLFAALPGLVPALLIVALLACVLVPLPPPLVDILLSLSLAGSVLLVVASLGIRKTTDFLGFPTLLLLVTLYRLALNISTTRLILSEAYAGEVIEAFASFVVRRDLVVGGVMFAIITIIQYVVIARGSERVAEVAARFALDGLPGHQAAIDADLRAGVVSPREAARRRARLSERSSFYGAMDGAVRFVKGDAIAGLAIIGVNLLGGVAIGVGRLDYGLVESLDVYGRLTIGDGLLAQIPALLVSLAAGILVSRVDREDEGPRSSVTWLQPSMLLVPALLLVVLALVPAMPGLAFVATSLALVTAALALSAKLAADPTRAKPSPERKVVVRRGGEPDAAMRDLQRALVEVRVRCSEALGIDVPPIELVASEDTPRGQVEISLDDRLAARTVVPPGCDGDDAVVLATFRAVMAHAAELVDLEDLDRAVEQVRATHPVVVSRALEVVELGDVLHVVRGFLEERIPLPPLRNILATMAEHRRFRDDGERPRFAEIVRAELAAHWLPPVLDGLSKLGPTRFVRLTPEAEEALLDRVVTSEEGSTLHLSPDDRDAWLDAFREISGGPADIAGSSSGAVAVIATPKARRAVARLLTGTTPHVPVFSTAELDATSRRTGAEPPSIAAWLDVP